MQKAVQDWSEFRDWPTPLGAWPCSLKGGSGTHWSQQICLSSGQPWQLVSLDTLPELDLLVGVGCLVDASQVCIARGLPCCWGVSARCMCGLRCKCLSDPGVHSGAVFCRVCLTQARPCLCEVERMGGGGLHISLQTWMSMLCYNGNKS